MPTTTLTELPLPLRLAELEARAELTAADRALLDGACYDERSQINVGDDGRPLTITMGDSATAGGSSRTTYVYHGNSASQDSG
jgi:putative ATP-grasp target RiPP